MSRGASGSRSVNVSGDAVGNVITTGDQNSINARVEAKLSKISLPPASSVDIGKEFAQIRALLAEIGGEHTNKIARALDDAVEETNKPKPDKDEIGSALARILDYAKKGNDFVGVAEKLAPHVTNAVAWLGSNWHKLLPLVGLAL